MSTCGFLKYISLLILVNVGQIPRTESAPVLATNRRVPVEGVSFSLTCTLDAPFTSSVLFFKSISIQGGCTSSGSCGTSVSGYSVSLDSTSRILTLDIASPDSTRDSGTWKCNVGTIWSNTITLSQFAAVLDWSSVTFSPQLTSLPSPVTPQNTISVTVTTPCAAPAAVITWRYQQGVSGVPPSSTSSSQGSCPSGQVQTTNTLSLPGNTSSLYNRQVYLTVSVEHDSFDPPTYTKSVTSNTIQFPVPVTSVTLTNINSDNEKIGHASGQSLTLTCVTSASFPTSNVTWVTLPPGTTPTVSTETTSGVLVKTTSSVTLTVSRSDQGRSIHCQAENINRQTSPQSNRATLEVWYPPDKPTTTNPGTLCEGNSTSLTCSSSPDHGNPPATFYWTKDNAAVHTGSSYTFSPVKADNGADIRCAAGNNYTDRAGFPRPQSDARQLSVYYVGVPTIAPAATQTRKEGQSLSLMCSADGNPDNAVISWTFNDSPIPGSSVMKADLNRSDDGEYGCTGRVNTGSVCPGGSRQGRSTVRVIVNYAPDITFSPVDITEGQPLTLKCEARGRPASYTFGSFIQYWGNTSVDSRAGTPSGAVYTWSVGAATYLDTGVYECRVNNTVTDRNDVLVQRKRVSVSVRASPKLSTMKQDARVGREVGEKVTLYRTYYSHPRYTNYTWSRGGQTLTTTHVSDTTIQLDIHGVVVEDRGYNFTLDVGQFDRDRDTGRYSLRVCNPVGCDMSTVELSVARPPDEPTQFKVIDNKTTTSVWLTWTPAFNGGYPQEFVLEYRKFGSTTWHLFGTYRDTEMVFVVEVNSLAPGETYVFRLHARNAKHDPSSTAFVFLEAKTIGVHQCPEHSYAGFIAGSVVGTALLILLVEGIIYVTLHRKGYKYVNTQKGSASGESARSHENETDNVGYSSLDQVNTLPEAPAHYTSLRMAEKSPPQKLYENTKD